MRLNTSPGIVTEGGISTPTCCEQHVPMCVLFLRHMYPTNSFFWHWIALHSQMPTFVCSLASVFYGHSSKRRQLVSEKVASVKWVLLQLLPWFCFQKVVPCEVQWQWRWKHQQSQLVFKCSLPFGRHCTNVDWASFYVKNKTFPANFQQGNWNPQYYLLKSMHMNMAFLSNCASETWKCMFLKLILSSAPFWKCMPQSQK